MRYRPCKLSQAGGGGADADRGAHHWQICERLATEVARDGTATYKVPRATGRVRIRLVPFGSSGSLGDLGVGRGLVGGAEAEECLEGGHGGAAAVVTEDILIEVDGQVLVLTPRSVAV